MATLINFKASIYIIFESKLLEHYLSRLKDYWFFVDK